MDSYNDDFDIINDDGESTSSCEVIPMKKNEKVYHPTFTEIVSIAQGLYPNVTEKQSRKARIDLITNHLGSNDPALRSMKR